jgi:hypothetical protein
MITAARSCAEPFRQAFQPLTGVDLVAAILGFKGPAAKKLGTRGSRSEVRPAATNKLWRGRYVCNAKRPPPLLRYSAEAVLSRPLFDDRPDSRCQLFHWKRLAKDVDTGGEVSL